MIKGIAMSFVKSILIGIIIGIIIILFVPFWASEIVIFMAGIMLGAAMMITVTAELVYGSKEEER